ncbi:MAG: GNAT family N-acetyltransferase [Gammaproteobacteria bacterium]
MRYEIVEGARAFMALEPAYRALYASSLASDPFNSPDWIYTWHAHYGDQGTPYAILIYDDHGQQLLCAFALFRIARARSSSHAQQIVPMAYNSADYLEPLITAADHAVSRPLASAIKKLLDSHQCALRIPEMPAVSAMAFCDALSQRGINYVDRRASLCPYVPLSGTFQEFLEARFNAKARQTFRRKLRRLNDRGEVSITLAQTGEALDALLPVIADIETQSWKGDKNIGLFSSSRSRNFYIDVLKKLAIAGKARITALAIAGEPIAYELGLLSASRYMMYGTGYLPGYRQYSPGAQLMLHNIRYSFGAGYRMYDLMCGDEDYKFQWATHALRNRSVFAFGSSLRGWLDYRSVQGYTRLRGLARRVVRGKSADDGLSGAQGIHG